MAYLFNFYGVNAHHNSSISLVDILNAGINVERMSLTILRNGPTPMTSAGFDCVKKADNASFGESASMPIARIEHGRGWPRCWLYSAAITI